MTSTRARHARRAGRLVGAMLVTAAVVAPALSGVDRAQALPGAGAAHALIQGSGSSWAANAVGQWVADVQQQGLQVVYNPSGDAQGRQDFANRTSDFAVTSLGYQGVDPASGVSDTSQNRRFAYLPIAAGGTAFPYQIKIHGVQTRNLRLSGETLAKIFTGQITNWDNIEITKDNNGHAIPSLPITPVVQSEGSGATAQLTRYFATEYPSIWAPFNHGVDKLTEYYPSPSSGSSEIAQNGSDGAMNYVSSSSANGSIGYVEYSYALSQNYPVVKMLNSAGYYTLPTQYNVAVSLEAAQINMDKNSPNYLLQNLDHVYTNSDRRTYPLSSYVYEIEPTGTSAQDSKITTAKRQTIADFTYYSICQGQKEIGPIGYSPLPVNLVEAGFGQLSKLKAADKNVDLTDRNVKTCNNPTFIAGHPNSNHLAVIAPEPPACDRNGAGPCAAGVTPNGAGTDPNSSGTVKDGKATNTKPASSTNTNTNTNTADPGTQGNSSNSTVGTKGASSTGTTGTDGTNPDGSTGTNSSSGDGTETADTSVSAPSGLAGYRSGHTTKFLAPLAVLLLVVALALPPLIGHRMAAAKRRSGG